MTATCQCGRPVDGATLCNTCTAALAADLHAVPDLAAELDVTLARQARFGERNGGRSAEKPLPYDVRASEAGWVLRNTLTTWCRVMIDELGQDMPKTGAVRHGDGLAGTPRYGRANQDVTTAETALWLSQRIHHLRTHPAAGEAAEEIRGAVQQVRDAVDAPANRATFPVGPCPENADDGRRCDGTVRAYFPTKDREQSPYMACDGEDRHRYEAHQFNRAGHRIKALQEQRERISA